MRAVIVSKPGTASVESVPEPICAPDGVIVCVERCGVCGTDQHLFEGDYGLARYPVIPGHEISGTVVEVGREVSSVHFGDHVVIEPNIHCEHCPYCRTQRGNHCLNLRVIGINQPGGFAEYVQAPERNIYVVAGLSAAQAAFVEPLACVVHGVRRLALQPGSRVLLAGAGPIGLLMLQTLHRSGAAAIVVTDLHASRLELAQRLGADACLQAGAAASAALREAAPLGFDAVIDCTGIPQVVESLVPYAANGGKVLLFGVAPEHAQMTIRPYELFQRDLTILGSFAVAYTFDAAIVLLEAGAVTVDGLVTHHLGLDGFVSGLTAARAGEGTLKVQLDPAQA
ncbi:MAG: zinc-dependent alcohol dehydrogenase family protein [Chloroflexi bacterium]|nr:zinc-dependent alcohol dehydrogenase family protein [Chloroflexota bacterium]